MGVKDLNVRDRYAAEARDEHVTKLNNVLYIIVVLVKVKTSKYLSKQTKFETKLEVKKKKNTQFLRFFWYRNVCDIW